MAPVPMIRRNHILRRLRKCGANCPERAVSLREAGVLNPDGFSRITQWMIRQGCICTVDGVRYFTP